MAAAARHRTMQLGNGLSQSAAILRWVLGYFDILGYSDFKVLYSDSSRLHGSQVPGFEVVRFRGFRGLRSWGFQICVLWGFEVLGRVCYGIEWPSVCSRVPRLPTWESRATNKIFPILDNRMAALRFLPWNLIFLKFLVEDNRLQELGRNSYMT